MSGPFKDGCLILGPTGLVFICTCLALQHVRIHYAVPLDCPAPLALSSRFAVDMVVKFGASMPGVRSDIIRRLRRKAKHLSHLDSALKELMPADVRRVGDGVNVAFVLYVMLLMGWPDLSYIEGVIFGFPIVGALDRPAFFRTARPQSSVSSREELLSSSVDWIDSLESTMGPQVIPTRIRQ